MTRGKKHYVKSIQIRSPYFPVFGLNTEKYEPEKTVCLDTFNAAKVVIHLNHLRLH